MHVHEDAHARACHLQKFFNPRVEFVILDGLDDVLELGRVVLGCHFHSTSPYMCMHVSTTVTCVRAIAF